MVKMINNMLNKWATAALTNLINPFSNNKWSRSLLLKIYKVKENLYQILEEDYIINQSNNRIRIICKEERHHKAILEIEPMIQLQDKLMQLLAIH